MIDQETLYHNQRIVCAANRDIATGDIILGARHWDMRMREAYADWMIANDFAKGSHFREQGFIDQFGQFHTRTEAWKIAVKADQILRRVGGDDADGGTLYSENLY